MFRLKFATLFPVDKPFNLSLRVSGWFGLFTELASMFGVDLCRLFCSSDVRSLEKLEMDCSLCWLSKAEMVLLLVRLF